MIVREFAFADAKTSKAMGLPAKRHGLIFAEDETAGGEHWTLVGDAGHVEMLRDAPAGARAGIAITPEAFPLKRPGWPDEW